MDTTADADALRKQWGKFVRTQRREIGMTQGQLAEASGIDQAEISRIERGLFRYVDPAAFLRVAAALRAPADVLFTWTVYPEEGES